MENIQLKLEKELQLLLDLKLRFQTHHRKTKIIRNLMELKVQWLGQLTWHLSLELNLLCQKGDTVLIIEAMKTMNHIPATQDGVVEEVCVNDGESVEFDQELIKIK
jgi:acetyl/propionyl-CoA carboxylase alpha subunit